MGPPSEFVPRELCERLEIALLATGTVEHAVPGQPLDDVLLDEVCVMCAWDCANDEERKAKVRSELAPYFGSTRLVFTMLPDLAESRAYVKRLIAALYG